MGQYQQWLHYQAIDQRLRAELQALEREVAELQRKNAHLLEHAPPASNTIVSRLTTGSNELTSSPKSTVSPPQHTEHTDEILSSSVPNLNLQEQQRTHPVEEAGKSEVDREKHHAETPSKVEEWLEDENSQTQPQLELPWWLRNMILSSSSQETDTTSSTSPIDKESIRTNRLVERWRERWGTHHPWMEGETPRRADGKRPLESEKRDE